MSKFLHDNDDDDDNSHEAIPWTFSENSRDDRNTIFVNVAFCSNS